MSRLKPHRPPLPIDDAGLPQTELPIDRGASINKLLIQSQADILGSLFVRPRVTGTTALGALFLRMFTWYATYAVGEEESLGSIEEGKWADFVLLSADPTGADPEVIPEMWVWLTVVAGEVVYDGMGGRQDASSLVTLDA